MRESSYTMPSDDDVRRRISDERMRQEMIAGLDWVRSHQRALRPFWYPLSAVHPGTWFQTVIENVEKGVKAGDDAAIELAATFISDDIRTHYSRMIKLRYLRQLKRQVACIPFQLQIS